MPYESFREVAALDIGAQRAVLHHGEAAERLWAAWALGLALGVEIAPELRADLNTAPEPGLRRQLIVILAGLGEHQLLLSFAEDDPDEYVRATACQYVIQTSLPSKREAQEFLLGRLFEDESATVRQTILHFARPNMPPA